MRSLFIDTSSHTTTIAFGEDGDLIHSITLNKINSHSETIAPLVEQGLAEIKIQISDITHIGVVVGPGSFTGLRIGISFVKGLALPHAIPVIPVSSLELLAFAAGAHAAPVQPLIDAKRKEAYTTLFNVAENSIREIKPESIVSLSSLSNEEAVMVYDFQNPVFDSIPKEGAIDSNTLSAAQSAVHFMYLKKDSALSADSIKPVYIRLSAAEEKFKPA